MTDLEVAFEYAHPPTRVWRALTEVPLLADWLGPCEGPPTFDVGERIRLRLDGLVDGPIDGELIDVLALEKLVMRWEGDQLQARVTWELTQTAGGSRLTCAVSGFLGLPTGPRRQQWRDGLASRIEVALPLVLAELAVASAAVRGALPARESLVAAIAAIEQLDEGTKKLPGPEIPRQRSGPGAPAVAVPLARKKRRTWLHAGVATGALVVLVATATALLLSATRPETVAGRVTPDELRRPALTAPGEPPAQQAVGTPAPTATGPAPPVSRPSAAATGGPAAPAPVPAPVPRPTLSAAYTVERTGLLGVTGYKVTARIDNPGPVAVGDWRLAFTLRDGQKAGKVSGARYRQDGTTVRFTPGDGAPPQGSVTVSFEVNGLLAGEPSGCTIDGRPCG